ncbi:nitroreductase family deazaflavin-dependent oxidoreductase [Actinophytocola sp. NPDC049390]|uniref:nitroreductase family deazaflavin-dependent oxidoreductase n=1 Tax=Actinophytocola sp. NPDC049390 TaxID=3363894 RepID=UPI0037A75C91
MYVVIPPGPLTCSYPDSGLAVGWSVVFSLTVVASMYVSVSNVSVSVRVSGSTWVSVPASNGKVDATDRCRPAARPVREAVRPPLRHKPAAASVSGLGCGFTASRRIIADRRSGVFTEASTFTAGSLAPQGIGGTSRILNTVGRWSGQPRETPPAWFADGDDARLIVASGGRASTPDWHAKLMANPDEVSVELPGEQPVPVTPRRIDGTERVAAPQWIVAAQPRLGKYQSKSGRRYPVVRLTRQTARQQ